MEESNNGIISTRIGRKAVKRLRKMAENDYFRFLLFTLNADFIFSEIVLHSGTPEMSCNPNWNLHRNVSDRS